VGSRPAAADRNYHKKPRHPREGLSNPGSWSSCLAGVVNDYQFPHPNLVAIIQRQRLLGCNLLFIYKSTVNAVQVFHIDLAALNNQLGMLAPDSGILPAKLVGIDIREDSTDRVFSTDDYDLFAWGDRE